ncbi:MAG TPA: hypothetical protein DCZ34_02075 [Clostridiales bacterium]|nr:hypothetical protein [Clostridiales bacterium]
MEEKYNYYNNRRTMMIEKGRIEDEITKLNKRMTSWQMKSFYILLAIADICSAIITKIPLIMTCAILQTAISFYDVIKDTISAGKIKKLESEKKVIDDYIKEIDEEYEKSLEAFMNNQQNKEDVKTTVNKKSSKRKMIEEILNRSKAQKLDAEDDETLTR